MAVSWPGVRGKRILLTGGTGGIGLAAAEALAAQGAHLAIVARHAGRGAAAAARIRAAGGADAQVDVLTADLSSLEEVGRLADEVLARYPRLDVLVNNAGALHMTRQLTPDGFELTWQVNHLAPFLLTTRLLDRLVTSAPARIVTTSSLAHRGARIPWDDLRADAGYRGWRRYGESKLANILFTVELARRLTGTGVTANCFHPGFVGTGFGRNNGVLASTVMSLTAPFARRPEKGAETLVWLAAAPEAGQYSGRYFVDRRPAKPSPDALDPEAASRLWTESEAALGARSHTGA